MDVNTFYALFSATCFTLLGLWWNVVQEHPAWTGDPTQRKAVGGVYLAFLLPALMGLFAQVGGDETPLIWRISFVGIAIVGLVSTVRILRVIRGGPVIRGGRAIRGGMGGRTGKHVVAGVIYLLVAVVGAVPEVGRLIGLRPIQAEALLLICLVLVGHGLVWEFLVNAATKESDKKGKATAPASP